MIELDIWTVRGEEVGGAKEKSKFLFRKSVNAGPVLNVNRQLAAFLRMLRGLEVLCSQEVCLIVWASSLLHDSQLWILEEEPHFLYQGSGLWYAGWPCFGSGDSMRPEGSWGLGCGAGALSPPFVRR